MPRRTKARVAATAPAPSEAALGCACASVRRAARLVTRLYDQQLRGVDIEAPQYALLTTLKRLGPCTQGALGRPHALDKTTVSRNLRLLERKGWVTMVASTDRRERQVTLTAAGERQRAAAAVHWKAAQTGLRAAMSHEEWTALFKAFAAVTRAAGVAASNREARR